MNERYIGLNISKKRQEKHLSQGDLAKKASISVDYVGKIERGERIPKLPMFVRLLNALDASADDILSDVLDNRHVIKFSPYLHLIGQLNREEQNRLFTILEIFLKEIKARSQET